MNMRKLFQLFSGILLCCLIIFLYQNRKEVDVEEKNNEPQIEVTPQEKPIPAKDRFSVVKMLDLSDSSRENIIDANGNDLVIGELYLQSKTNLKLYPISNTLSIYQEVDYSLAVDNKEETSIKVRGEHGFFFIQGLVLLPEVGKEIILDSSDHYQMVMN